MQYQLLNQVQEQIKEAFEYIKNEFNKDLLDQILRPDQVLKFPLTIKMDNWENQTFWAFRSQHNKIRWPYKWWLRFHQNVNEDEVISLSTRMSLKTAVAWIPLWGWKWGICVNPKKLSRQELEKLSRAFMQKLYKHIGPNIDIPAPDVNTNWQIMSWMLDEYIKLTWKLDYWTITWKPLEVWWSKWRKQATSLGWLFVLQKYLELNNNNLNWKTIAIQWAWNVGWNFAILAQQAWAKIIAISDSSWWIVDNNWLDINKIIEWKKQNKKITDLNLWKKITNEELLELNVDILVPSALEKVINQENANKIQAKIILELANWPTTKEADKIFENKNITVIPDILANAWWVTVSYFEQVQNNTNYYWELEEVNNKLEKIMKEQTKLVFEYAKKYNTSMRNWAYILALKRILSALKYRK